MSSSPGNQVVAESKSDFPITKSEAGFQDPVALQGFEYNLNTNVNHTFFSNIINEPAEEGPERDALRSKHTEWFAQNYVQSVSAIYDKIPGLEFGGDDIRFAEKDQTLAWISRVRNESEPVETDNEKDERAGEALQKVMQNNIQPHVRTPEFVTIVKDKVLTNVWYNTDGSIYSDVSVQDALTAKTNRVDAATGAVFFDLKQCTEIMRQFRRLGRVKNYTFDKGSHEFANASDVTVSWISFVKVDSIGIPTLFTAVDTDGANDIQYQGKTFVAGSVIFALKFIVNADTTRTVDSVNPTTKLISNFQSISWKYNPTEGDINGSDNQGFQG
jgi:hypothetical protein